MKFLTILFLGIVLWFYSSEIPLLDQIQTQGELRVATRHGPSTYYQGPKGAAGLEYDLAKRFADELGVKLHVIVIDNFADILQTVANQEVHFAAAGLTIDDERKILVRFAPSYQEVTQQIVYRQGSSPPPNNLADWNADYKLTVIAGSSQSDFLKYFKTDHPQFTWEEVAEIEPGELLEQVWDGEVKYALVNSNEVTQMRRFYPELQIAFELPEPQQLAWAFPRLSSDDSLYLAAIQFFNRLQRSGQMAQLLERYYGHLDDGDEFDYVNFRRLHRHIKERLPKYRSFFEQVATRYQLDWRLLAAIGYEESQWNPTAVSATGVRGLMMLTKSTAQEMGVVNRDDPVESIAGGAKYFLGIKARINTQIPEPDRTWFALAAYNVGLGHLKDALQLTADHGNNPNRWVDVKEYLAKLSDGDWHRQTQYGYARGYEPVKFVKSVRRCYDILVRYYSQPEVIPRSPSALPNKVNSAPHTPMF